jgi:hypothetical protein
MTQTLKREIKQKIRSVFMEYKKDGRIEGGFDGDESSFIEALANTVLEVAGISKRALPSGSGLDWMIATGVTSQEIAETQSVSIHEQAVLSFYEERMGYNPLDWWTDKDLSTLRRFLLTKTQAEITAFSKWSREKYSTFPPTKARQYPLQVIDLWPQAQSQPPDDTPAPIVGARNYP